MAVDGPTLAADDARMIGMAIRRQLEAAQKTPAQLARDLGVADSTVSRLLAGQIEDVTIGRILQIEEALGVPRGHLFRAAGLVDDELSVRQRIETDPLLTAGELRLVLRIYDSSVAASAEERSSSGSSKAPTPRSTRRN